MKKQLKIMIKISQLKIMISISNKTHSTLGVIILNVFVQIAII